MNDTSSTPPVTEGEGSSNHTPESYAIAPEDAELAKSFTEFHPIYDVQGPVTSDAPIKAPSAFTLDMLSKDLRSEVEAELADIPEGHLTPQREQVVLKEALERQAYKTRVYGGPGADADDYKQAWFLLEHDRIDAENKLFDLQLRLANVIRQDKVVNEETGAESFEPVYALQGDARSAAEHEVADLKHRIALLEGSEGKRRLERGLYDAVQKHKRQQEELAIEQEAEALAAKNDREERIAEKAKARQQWKRTER